MASMFNKAFLLFMCSGIFYLVSQGSVGLLAASAASLDSCRARKDIERDGGLLQAGPAIPNGLGVNIHFTNPRPGEMKMLAEGGFRWVRMDFSWGQIEKTKGQYDFTPYDQLMAALHANGICALFILDYSNKFYDNGLSPYTDEGRQAFARWTAASVRHFQGRGIYWEMYNEPNIVFWRPKPNVDDYVKLALTVGRAIREAGRDETYIGPAANAIDFGFLEVCFKAGLLEYWSAVSVHPYRQTGPEAVADEYRRLRELILQYAPRGKRVPILSGEWGYSSAWKEFDEAKQGKMLARQWLTNFSNEIPLSIWYDWHDDGIKPAEPEHHFGTVGNNYYEGRDPVYDAKPAYRAAKTLSTVLNGYQFRKRLRTDRPEDYVLVFSKGDNVRLAAWTTLDTPHGIVIPASPGQFSVTAHIGLELPEIAADKKGLSITLTDAPQYIVPEKLNKFLREAAER